MIDILHHLGLITRSMPATIERYERLGFRFTPLSLPRIPLHPGGEPQLLGVANRTAVFENNYLEVLAVTDAERWAQIPVSARGPFDIDPPPPVVPHLSAMTLAVRDLSQVRTVLAGVSFNEHEGRLIVSARDAGGVNIVFEVRDVA
ncbi:Hypothetical protein A7982_05500 [Minicystis rosea]|nr:Hypothetical protein A7982_05500 [Minicystis rosea]